MFKIAFRSIFRNARRSLTTMLTIAIGTAALLVFAAYALYDVYILQTATVQRGGHLTVYHKGFFDFGSGDPALWGIPDHASVIELIKDDGVLKPLTAVVTPVQGLGGIAENPDASFLAAHRPEPITHVTESKAFLAQLPIETLLMEAPHPSISAFR